MNQDILNEIKHERMRQNLRWGGPNNDDMKDVNDWYRIISDYNSCARLNYRKGSGLKYREKLIQIAALAAAAVESFDRNSG